MSTFSISCRKSYTSNFMRTLYFDCFAGASGNMILGALVGAGAQKESLLNEISRLGLEGYDIEFLKVNRSGVSATFVDVKVPHEHSHRHLADIEKIIAASGLSDSVKERAIGIFTRLAEAEAKVHGIDVQKVHFHEVGAMDAIIDIVGACVGFELLGIERFVCSRIHVGSGFVEMSHGRFPIPPPAVTELLQGFPIYSTEIEGELMTPTGAAIISTLSEPYDQISNLTPEVVSYGAGGRDYDRFPNVLRIIVGESEPASIGEEKSDASVGKVAAATTDRLFVLETNIDDIAPQVLGYVMEQAFHLGALDCWFTPIQMKKNRPAVTLSILCKPGSRGAMTELLYRETTTLGIRIRETERECLAREIVNVSTEFGSVDVKLGRLNGNIVNAMPEYDQVKTLALKYDVPFLIVSEAALSALSRQSLAAGK